MGLTNLLSYLETSGISVLHKSLNELESLT